MDGLCGGVGSFLNNETALSSDLVESSSKSPSDLNY
jgi:hypothetical protein